MPALRGIAALTVAGSSVLLASCFTSTADFKRDAEVFIRDEVAAQLDTTFQSVTCVQPVDQEVGTRFTCSALDADSRVWEFDNLIDEPGEFSVSVSRRP